MSEHESTPTSPPPPPPPAPSTAGAEEQLSAGPASSTTQDSNGAPSPFGSGVVQECLQAAQRFRGGEYSREEAIYHIFDTLGSANQPTAVVFQGARPYIDMVEKIQAEQRGAEHRGHALGGTQAGPAVSVPDEEREFRAASISVGLPDRPKRRRADPVSDSDDEDDRGGKRPLDLSSLPWMQNVEAATLPQQLADTRRLLILFAQEPKRWKTFFTNEPNCPQFPDGEWSNILTGKPVNLDVVLASMFNVSLDHKLKERIGRVSLALDDVTPSRVVKSQGDWISAWTRTVDATAFVFRHRRDELNGYTSYVSSLFASILEANHSRLLAYDRSIRSRVAARRDLYLTDVHQFTDLHTQWISSVGIGAGSGASRSGGTRSSGKSGKPEACRRWNDGKCPFPANKCNWGHVCIKCSGAHTASVCTQRA